MLQRAVEQLDTLAAENVKNPKLQDALGQAYLNLSVLPDMSFEQKELILQKHLMIYQRLTTDHPDNLHFREQAALGNLEFGELQKVRGNISDSLRYFQNAITFLEQLVADEPANLQRRVNLANARLNTATLYSFMGETENQFEAVRQALDLIVESRRLNSADNETNLTNYSAHLQLGNVLTASGDYPAAVAELRQTLENFEREFGGGANDTRSQY